MLSSLPLFSNPRILHLRLPNLRPIPIMSTLPDPNPNRNPIPVYPVPLSPPLPPISKEIELRRAMTASSRSSMFRIEKTDVVFEDEWLIAVNKPQGVYCERVLDSVAGFVVEETNCDRNGNLARPAEFHLANRLDRDTSGVLVVTKSHKVAAKLVQAFTDHKVQKTYIATCIGSAPTWDRIRISSGHGRSKHGVWRVYAASDVGRALPNGSTVKTMETSFQVLGINEQGGFTKISGYPEDEDKIVFAEEKSEISNYQMKDEILVRAFPRSGRTHQIRLHCQYLGMPIKGDVKYEGIHEWKGEICDGHLLHAESLLFEHPVTHLPVLIEAPVPSWVWGASGR